MTPHPCDDHDWTEDCPDGHCCHCTGMDAYIDGREVSP